MKTASVHNHMTRQTMYDERGAITIPVFNLWYLHRTQDVWSFNLLCFLNGVTDDWRWFSLVGVFSFGLEDNRPFIRFTPGMTPLRIWPARDAA